jgi:hypothetical protein
MTPAPFQLDPDIRALMAELLDLVGDDPARRLRAGALAVQIFALLVERYFIGEGTHH